MGLEARCACRTKAGLVQVKALLETHELILRQGIRRSFTIARLTETRVSGRELQFSVGGEQIALELGEAQAARWLKKINTPPPTLAEKLGVVAGHVVLVGTSEDGVVENACAATSATLDAEATMLIAVVETEAALDAALDRLDRLASNAAIWCVYRKGPRAFFGETLVRATMRERGFIDIKISAVSALYSATKYVRREGRNQRNGRLPATRSGSKLSPPRR